MLKRFLTWWSWWCVTGVRYSSCVNSLVSCYGCNYTWLCCSWHSFSVFGLSLSAYFRKTWFSVSSVLGLASPRLPSPARSFHVLPLQALLSLISSLSLPSLSFSLPVSLSLVSQSLRLLSAPSLCLLSALKVKGPVAHGSTDSQRVRLRCDYPQLVSNLLFCSLSQSFFCPSFCLSPF